MNITSYMVIEKSLEVTENYVKFNKNYGKVTKNDRCHCFVSIDLKNTRNTETIDERTH